MFHLRFLSIVGFIFFFTFGSSMGSADPGNQLTPEQYEAARVRVKQRFVGLDSLVDSVMDQMKSWALYPETRIRPQVIFLAGPTSTGKTALVNSIISELSLKRGFLYFDMDRYSQPDGGYHNFGSDLESLLGARSGEEGYQVPNDLVLMFDELQKINTKSGNALIARPNVSKIWELLGNDGHISVSNPALEKARNKYRMIDSNLLHYEQSAATNEKAQTLYERMLADRDRYAAEILTLPRQITLNLSGALIFMAANLDHVFAGSRILDAEVLTADQLHALTSEVTPSDVKIGLGHLFRPEHVGRFGNRIIPVPTLPEAAFRRLIDMRLQEVSSLAAQTFRMRLTFSERFKERIYNEGVIPSQGPRPLQTAIGTFALDPIGTLYGMIAEHPQYTTDEPAHLSADVAENEDFATWTIQSGPLAGTSSRFSVPIEHIRSRQLAPEPKRSVVAARVAGSVTVYAGLKHLLPRWVRANSRASNRFGSIDFPETLSVTNSLTRSELIDIVAVQLAPFVAETLIFGETTLASMSEHQEISILLEKMVNLSGMGTSLISVTPYVNRSSHDLQTDYELILAEAKERAKTLLLRESHFLSKLAEELTQYAEIERARLAEIVNATWTVESEAEIITTRLTPRSNCEQMLTRFIKENGQHPAQEASLLRPKKGIGF